MKINPVGCEFRTLFVFREVGGLDQLSVISQKKKEIGNPAILILKGFCVVSAT
jgi:squalene-hopene/tetraprenyl-beta-curcumene cyclase